MCKGENAEACLSINSHTVRSESINCLLFLLCWPEFAFIILLAVVCCFFFGSGNYSSNLRAASGSKAGAMCGDPDWGPPPAPRRSNACAAFPAASKHSHPNSWTAAFCIQASVS